MNLNGFNLKDIFNEALIGTSRKRKLIFKLHIHNNENSFHGDAVCFNGYAATGNCLKVSLVIAENYEMIRFKLRILHDKCYCTNLLIIGALRKCRYATHDSLRS